MIYLFKEIEEFKKEIYKKYNIYIDITIDKHSNCKLINKIDIETLFRELLTFFNYTDIYNRKKESMKLKCILHEIASNNNIENKYITDILKLNRTFVNHIHKTKTKFTRSNILNYNDDLINFINYLNK